MRDALPSLCLLLAGLAAAAAQAADASALAEAAARAHAGAQPGQVSVSVGASASLPPCEDLQAQVPPGSPALGEVQVALRCQGGMAWTRFVPVRIAVQVRHAVTAVALPAGHRLRTQDLRWQDADLARLPADALLDEAGTEGAVTVHPLAAGAPLRRSGLKLQPVILQGQTVRLLLQGPGYQLSTEGRAQSHAAPGQGLLLRLGNGQTVSAVAQADGTARK